MVYTKMPSRESLYRKVGSYYYYLDFFSFSCYFAPPYVLVFYFFEVFRFLFDCTLLMTSLGELVSSGDMLKLGNLKHGEWKWMMKISFLVELFI